MLKIRKMMLGDTFAVSNIEKEIFSNPWTKEGFENILKKDQYLCLLAEIQGNIIGYCIISLILDEGELLNIGVKESYRNNLVASRLLKESLYLAMQEGVHSVILEVREKNRAAIALYRQFGFEKIGIRKDFYENPKEDGIVMKKQFM